MAKYWASLIGVGVLLVGVGSAVAQDYKVKVTPRRPPAESNDKQPGDSPSGDDEKSDADDTPGAVGGYSWGGSPQAAAKPVPRRRPRAKKQYDRATPIVTFPGFRLLPDGTSLIWVTVSKRVPVTVERAKGRVSYTLEGAHVQIQNNTNPLVTAHFDTPVTMTRLLPGVTGVRLVVDVRQMVDIEHEEIEGPRGTMLLRIRVASPNPTPTVPSQSEPAGSMSTTAPDPEPELRSSAQVRSHASVSGEGSVSIGKNKKNRKKRDKRSKRRRRKK